MNIAPMGTLQFLRAANDSAPKRESLELRSNGYESARLAFTLVELLVVIAIAAYSDSRTQRLCGKCRGA